MKRRERKRKEKDLRPQQTSKATTHAQLFKAIAVWCVAAVVAAAAAGLQAVPALCLLLAHMHVFSPFSVSLFSPIEEYILAVSSISLTQPACVCADGRCDERIRVQRDQQEREQGQKEREREKGEGRKRTTVFT